MKSANLYEATEVMSRARDVILNDHPLDKRPHTRSSLGVMLLEHDKPVQQIFPNKENMKPIALTIRGDTPPEEVQRLLNQD